MADLSEFYPKPQNPSPNGAGRPANPAAVQSAGKFHASPAFWTLVFVAGAFVALHLKG